MPARSNDQTMELPTPIGGMEHRVGRTQVGSNSFLKLENIDFARNVGILATRKGLVPITTTAVPGSDRIRGGTRFYRSNGKDLVVFADDTGGGTGQALKFVSPSTWTLLVDFPTVGREYHTTSYLDRLYMANGADAPQTFDGVTTRAMGFIAPSLYPAIFRARSLPDAMEAFGNKQFEGGVTAANIGGLEGAGVDFSGFGTSGGNFDALIIASRKKFNRIKITMDGANVNATAAVVSAKFWNDVGGTWDTLTVGTDGTASGGASLAQTGEIDLLGVGSTIPAGWTAIPMSDGRPDMYVLALMWGATIDTPTKATTVEVRDWRDDHLAGVQGFEVGDKRVYAFSFVYGTEGESSISPVSPVMEADGTDMLVALPLGGTGVTGRNVYRTKDGNNTELFLLKVIDNNTADGFIDNVNDLQLTSVTVPKDNGVPPIAQFIVSIDGRVFMARGNTLATQARLSFSAVSELEFAAGGEDTHHAGPEIFPKDFFIDIGDNNTPLTGLSVVLGQVVIFKEDGLYILDGTNPSEFRVIKVHGGVGCIAPRTIATIDGKLYFLSRNRGRPALYEFAGGFVRPHPGLPIEEFWADNVDQSILEEAAAGTHHGMYRITMPSTEAGLSNREYIYDVHLKRWGMNSRIVAGVYIPWTGSGDQGELYYGSKETAFVIQVDQGETDQISGAAAVAIGGEIEMGFQAFGRPSQIKQIRRIHLMMEVDPAASPVPTYTLERTYDFGVLPVTFGDVKSDTNVPIDPRMELSGASGHHSIHHHTIVCGGSAKGDLRDQGYYVKLRMTHTGRIKWHRTSIDFDLYEVRSRHAD